MVIGKLTAALLLLATAAPTALASPAAHLRIRIKSNAAVANTSSNAVARNSTILAPPVAPAANNITGSLFGAVDKVDAAQYKITACAPQTWNITRANATAVWLDFASISAPGDRVTVSALNGSHPQVFNVAAEGISTKPIADKGVRIVFQPLSKEDSPNGCAATGKLPSFVLSNVGYSSQKAVKKETVCGDSHLVNVQCVNQLVKDLSDAVMRLLISKDGKAYWCTGWLWGSKGHIITNHHCISKQAHADGTKFQFGVEMSNCKDKECDPNKCSVGETLLGKGNVELVKADDTLDYAVLKITKNADKWVSKYGYLKIRDGDPVAHESFYLVQHPSGRPKLVDAIIESDRIGVPRLTALYGTGKGITSIGYTADTEGGSSGSPLISHKDKLVIGLHHWGGCPNEAVSSNQLANALRSSFSDINGFVKG